MASNDFEYKYHSLKQKVNDLEKTNKKKYEWKPLAQTQEIQLNESQEIIF